MIVVPDAGAIELLNKTLLSALAVADDYSLRLYRNDYTPVAGSVLASFLEATFAGYFRHTLLRSGWGAPSIVAGRARVEYTASVTDWTCTAGSQTIYGYYVVAPASGAVAWAERFTDPVNLAASGKLVVLPRFTGRGEV